MATEEICYNSLQLYDVNDEFAQQSLLQSNSTNLDLPFVRIHNFFNDDDRPTAVVKNNSSFRQQNRHEIKAEPIKAELNDGGGAGANGGQTTPNNRSTPNSGSSSNVPDQNEGSKISKPDSLKFLKCLKCVLISTSQSDLDIHKSSENCAANNSRLKLECPGDGCTNYFYSKLSLASHLQYDHFLHENEIKKYLNQIDTKKSRIYLKNVECLREPSTAPTTTNQFQPDTSLLLNDTLELNSNFGDTLNFIDLINDSPLLELHSTVPAPKRIGIKSVKTLCEQQVSNFDDDADCEFLCVNHIEQNKIVYDMDNGIFSQQQQLSSQFQEQKNITNLTHNNRNERPKIYIKNVDILKDPAFLPPIIKSSTCNSNFQVNLSISPGDFNDNNSIINIPPTSLHDGANNNVSSETNIFQNFENQNEQLKPKSKIYIKNVDILKEGIPHTTNDVTNNGEKTSGPLLTSSKTNFLHLRTDLFSNEQVSCSPNFSTLPNNDNAMGIVEFSDRQFANCNDLISSDFTRTYDISSTNNVNEEYENLVINSDNACSIYQYDLNTPQGIITTTCDIVDDAYDISDSRDDNEILFVCAEELINSNNQVKESNVTIKTSKLSKDSNNDNFIEVQEIEVTGNGEQKSSACPEKGRIYVSENLMDSQNFSSDTNNVLDAFFKKKTKGRPLNSKNTKNVGSKINNGSSENKITLKCNWIDKCGFKCEKDDTLEYHRKCHYGATAENMQCPECKSTEFSSWNNLLTHLWRQHQIDLELYSCSYSSCSFKTPILSRLLNIHMKIHSEERNYACWCKKTFKNSKQLKNHRRIHRKHAAAANIQELYKCGSCDAIFSSERTKKQHYCTKSIDNEKSANILKCSICAKIFSSKNSLRLHELIHETINFKFNCSHCEYKTNDHNSFRRHKGTHDKTNLDEEIAMIAASEPLEFIPRGRLAVGEHPGPHKVNQAKQQIDVSEHILHRMQNVNLSADNELKPEYWSIREILDEFNVENITPKMLRMNNTENNSDSFPPYITDYLINSEEELYFKGHTAVWTKGLNDSDNSVCPRICFTCDTPIKFAFFCHENFIMEDEAIKVNKKIKNNESENERNMDEIIRSVCIIDSTSIHVYCRNGEDYLANLEFPISNVWVTRMGIILEKEASTTIIQSHLISMPRFFSLTHPLNEMCPILIKSSIGTISYLTETDYRIIFSSPDNDLFLLFDNKIGKHFVARLRKANAEEVQIVGCGNESNASQFNQTNRRGFSFIQSSLKNSISLTKNSPSLLARSSLGNTGANVSSFSKNLGARASPLLTNYSPANSIKSNLQSPIERLQSSIGPHSSTVQDIRKLGQTQPSKPIVPEFSLEHIWTESLIGKDFCEIASKAFMHTDLIGQIFLCYLLPHSSKLHLTRLEKTNSPNTQIFGMVSIISAKDAIALEKMKMIAILDENGSVTLYSGPVLVSKVHISGFTLPNIMPLNVTTPNLSGISRSVNNNFLLSNFPRRSSLLPTIHISDTQQFDQELHLLSPVHPLRPDRGTIVCNNLRDPAGNRLTLDYSNGKMFRISLPLLNENHFITKCLSALRQVLKKELSLQLLIRWYSARNAPGTQNFSFSQEWETFSNILYELLGRSISSNESSTNIFNTEEPKKRRKDIEDDNVGTNDDWDFMNGVNKIKIKNSLSIHHNDHNAPLYSQLTIIFYTLHLLYEDLKLDETMTKYLCNLVELLYQLASDMKLNQYCLHYLMDFPHLKDFKVKNFFSTDDLQRIQYKNIVTELVPDIFKQVLKIIKGNEDFQYPYIFNVNVMSKNILQLISVILHGHVKIRSWITNVDISGTPSTDISRTKKRMISVNVSRCEQVIQMLINMDLSRKSIQRLPAAIHFIIAEALEHCRISPPTDCSFQAYELLLRPELVSNAKKRGNDFSKKCLANKTNINKENSLSLNHQQPNVLTKTEPTQTDEDGMENIDTKLLSLRFPEDLRINEIRRLLNSCEPVLIDITQSPGVSDHEFIEEQEKQLYAICTRTMSLPMGRGMLTLRSSTPGPTESMPIPKLCLSGKEPIKGATIEMQQIEFPPNMNLWPSFHNGVSAGLRISPNAKDIDSTWIVYNKPKQQNEVIPTEHAGFLMGLGLNGHLKNLSYMSVYEYLVKCDEMTSVGLLLGISATHRGTMDNTTTKLLSVHIEALLPATALELDIPQNIQVASLMGVGLIYQGTAKRHIAEILLQEIGRPPGPEMENSVERESYALTSGLALGLVTLGQGESPAGLRDLQLPDTLHYYMIGGNKRPLTGSQKEKYKLASFQVREGETVNIDVTAPGATLALGLMFFNTGNKAVAQWMMPPDTSYLLDLIRPDLLLLRIISKGLILWNEIRPDYEWLFDQFPSKLEFDLKRGPDASAGDIDHEANAQAYCNIIAGAAFCIGLKYAGTENPVAFKALMKTIKLILSWTAGQYVGEYAGKATVESSLILVLISVSLVYAGTGNLEILRIIRFLRSRIGPSNAQVTYGSQMGIHMALGFLFLGAGRYTLSRSPEAIAALVCALFPKFPNHSNDNRYHLQAFRHLYVLAVEPRIFLPRDIDTGKLCLCYISCIEIGSNELKQLPMAPCILPELNTLKCIIVNDPNYWPICFERGRNWNQLEIVLQNCDCVDIKKRVGCLSHLEDPNRLKSLLAQTLTTEQYRCWKIEPYSLMAFSSDVHVVEFIDKFLDVRHDKRNLTNKFELERSQLLVILFYNCLTKDKMHGLPIYLSLLNALEKINHNQDLSKVWQFKIINAYQQLHQTQDTLLSTEILGSIIEKLKFLIEYWRSTLKNELKQYILSTDDSYCGSLENTAPDCLQKVMTIIRFYDLHPKIINFTNGNYLKILYEMKNVNTDIETINCIMKIFK